MSQYNEARDAIPRTRLNGVFPFENARKGKDGGIVADVTMTGGYKLTEVPVHASNTFVKSGYAQVVFRNNDKSQPEITSTQGKRGKQHIPEKDAGFIQNPANPNQRLEINEDGAAFKTDKKPIDFDGVKYDPETKTFEGNGLKVNFKDKTIEGDFTLKGNISVNGTITSNGKITAPNIT